MPVISVMDRSTIESVRPLLNTVAHAGNALGSQVSMDTQKAANTTHHNTRMMRSICGARAEAAIGGGGGSMVAIGSRLASSWRIPGRKSSAPTKKMNGSDGMMAA